MTAAPTLSRLARARLACCLLGLAWCASAAAQTLAFRDAITQQTALAGVTHAAWSPDGAHLYAVAEQDHTLIQFIPAGDGSLAFGQVLRDGADGVDGLGGAIAVAVSPDGAHVYVAGAVDDAVVVFSRDDTSGGLAFVESLADGVGGVDGLDGASFVVVSPDGAHVYVAGADEDAVAVFSRNATSGALAFVQALPRNVDLGGVRQLAISPDGTSLYAAAPDTSTLVVLDRDAGTGMLGFVQSFEAYLFGTQDPDEIVGMLNVNTVAVSPDGAHVYVASPIDDTIIAFDRDGGTGALTHSQTIEDGVGGVDGLNGPNYLAISPDGASIHVAVRVDDAVSTFDRDGTSGDLAFAGTQPGGLPELDFADAAIVSPDGTLVHGISGSARNLVGFTRDTGTGVLTLSAIRDEPAGDVVGLSQLRSMAVDAGGNRIYTAGAQDHAIGVFARDAGNQALRFVEAQRNGVDGVRGLTEVNDVVVSPDRRFVYAVSPVDEVVAIFSVIGIDGELRFERTMPNAAGAPGMGGAAAMAMSDDGRHLYVAGRDDGAIVVYARHVDTGHLVRLEAHVNGEDGITGMANPDAIAISPDGSLLLVASAFSTQVVVFSRDADSGRLVHEPQAMAKGFGSAARRILFSPDGLHVFVITESPQQLLVLTIDLATGAPVITEIQQLEGTGTGIAISEDGTTVTVTDADTATVEVYARDPETGFLTLMDSATNGQGGVSGIADPAPVLDPPDGLADVLVGDRDGSLALFATAPAPVPAPVDVDIFKAFLLATTGAAEVGSPRTATFNIIVSNKRSDSSASVFVEDLLPAGATSGQWQVSSEFRSSLSGDESGSGDLRLGFQLEPSEGVFSSSVVLSYFIEAPSSLRYFNRATVTADGDINLGDNVAGAPSTFLPILLDGFEIPDEE